MRIWRSEAKHPVATYYPYPKRANHPSRN